MATSGARQGPDRRHGVEAIETGARLLAVLADAHAPMMLRDLAAAADMAPAKAHRYLVSLIRVGLASQHPQSARYDIGALAIRLGLAGAARNDALTIARAQLPALRDTLGLSVALGLWSDGRALIVHWLDSNAPVSATLRTGASMPLTRSATGRAFAAFDRSAPVQACLRAELARNAREEIAPASADAMRAIVDTSRRHGLARVSGELVEGIDSLAAPVFGADGRLALVVAALGHSRGFDAGWDGPVARRLRRWADDTGRLLGAPATARPEIRRG